MRSSAIPGATIATRHPRKWSAPKATTSESTSGITICVAPPPRFPHPAVVALAVPTTLGANIADVWYCVMTKEAPITPMPRRNSRKLS